MAVSQSLTLTEIAVDKAANTSTVRIVWKSTQTGESWNGYERTAKLYVQFGSKPESIRSVNYTLPQNSTVTIINIDYTSVHNVDGSGTVTVRTWMDTGISAGVIEQTKSLTLTTIPRASTLEALSCNTAYFNGTMTYKYRPKITTYYNRCNIALNIDGGYTAIKTIDLGKKGAALYSATVNLSESELSTIYNQLPSAKQGKLRFTLRTYSDSGYSAQVGDADYLEITLAIPDIDATKPTATMTLSPVSSLSSPFDTLYIKGRSKVDANFTNGEGKYGASIVSYKMSVAGKSYGSPFTSVYITTEGEVTVTGTVTDSRGYSRTYTQKINVLPYANPRIIPVTGESEIVAARCDSGGNLSDSGTYLKIKAKRSYSKVSGHNNCSVQYRYKAEGGSYSAWTTILATTATSDEIVTGALLGTLDVMSTYLVQVQAVDTIGETGTTTISLPTERVYMHKAGSINALGIGKYAEEENTVDIGEDITVKVRGGLKLGANGFEVADFICEDTILGSWRCRKWNSGVVEAYGSVSVTVYPEGVYGSLYYEAVDVALPSGLFAATPYIQIQTLCQYGLFAAHLRTLSKSAINVFISNSNIDSRGELEVTLFIYAFGKWK